MAEELSPKIKKLNLPGKYMKIKAFSNDNRIRRRDDNGTMYLISTDHAKPKNRQNYMDASWPLSKRLPFKSLKTSQWLSFWNC